MVAEGRHFGDQALKNISHQTWQPATLQLKGGGIFQ